MAITVLPGQSVGSQIGTGLGNVLSQGLQNIANTKLQNLLQQQERAQQMPGLLALGLNPQQASSLSMLPANVQQEVIKQHLAGPSNQLFAAALNDALGGTGTSSLQAVLGQPAQGTQQAPGMQQASGQQGLNIPAGLKPQQALQLAQLGQQRKQFEEKIGLEKSKIAQRKQEHIDKETLPFVKEIQEKALAARDSDMRLNRIEELNNFGELGNEELNLVADMLGKVGIDISAIQTADAQELKKLSTDFLKDAGKFFHGKVTDNDVKIFLMTTPTLMQSQEGRARVINNLRLMNEAYRVENDAMNEIIEEHGGERPRNIATLVEKKSKKRLDEIADAFKKGVRSDYKNYKAEYPKYKGPVPLWSGKLFS